MPSAIRRVVSSMQRSHHDKARAYTSSPRQMYVQQGDPQERTPSSAVDSTIETLLLSTKSLLDALARWSTLNMTETQVSDVYVCLGDDFNAVLAAFRSHDISIPELESIIRVDLRDILETCLAEDPSPDVFRTHLPDIRRIIDNLMQSVRAKQRTYQRQCSSSPAPRRKRADAQSFRSETTSRRRARDNDPLRKCPEDSKSVRSLPRNTFDRHIAASADTHPSPHSPAMQERSNTTSSAADTTRHGSGTIAGSPLSRNFFVHGSPPATDWVGVQNRSVRVWTSGITGVDAEELKPTPPGGVEVYRIVDKPILPPLDLGETNLSPPDDVVTPSTDDQLESGSAPSTPPPVTPLADSFQDFDPEDPFVALESARLERRASKRHATFKSRNKRGDSVPSTNPKSGVDSSLIPMDSPRTPKDNEISLPRSAKSLRSPHNRDCSGSDASQQFITASAPHRAHLGASAAPQVIDSFRACIEVDGQVEEIVLNSDMTLSAVKSLLSRSYNNVSDKDFILRISRPHFIDRCKTGTQADASPAPSPFDPRLMPARVAMADSTSTITTESDLIRLPSQSCLLSRQIGGLREIVGRIQEATLGSSITFDLRDPPERGMPVWDALSGSSTRLIAGDETVFGESEGYAFIHFMWPGYGQWITSVAISDDNGPITKLKLAEVLAQKFIKDLRERPTDDPQWQVGPGHNIAYEDLVLVSLCHISAGRWQATVTYECNSLRRAPS